MPDNAIRKVAFSEFLLGLLDSFNLHSLVSTLVSNACSKMLISGTAKQKKPSMITSMATKMDLLLCVCVCQLKWRCTVKLQDESTVALDKYGLKSLLSNIRIPPKDCKPQQSALDLLN